MQSDIEIANAAVLRPIREVAAETLGFAEEHLVPYGHYKAKVDIGYLTSLADRPLGQLVLVTALSPTPPGEGKTTTTVGLAALAFFAGAGGLGEPLEAQKAFKTNVVFAGGLCVLLAVVLDAIILIVQRSITPWTRAA